MTAALFTALIGFAFVTSITPGPNNLMLMTSGANFGFARTVPHLIGVSGGFTIMVALVGIGLARIFEAYPAIYDSLKLVSVGYLLFLAWKIAHAAPPVAGAEAGKPLTFLHAASFQWVNPKALAMALTAVTAYAPSTSLGHMVVVALVFGAVNVPSVSCWIVLGQQMRRILTNPAHLRLFNWVMAVLLIASLIPVLIGG